jgi:hypothetical protein
MAVFDSPHEIACRLENAPYCLLAIAATAAIPSFMVRTLLARTDM